MPVRMLGCLFEFLFKCSPTVARSRSEAFSRVSRDCSSLYSKAAQANLNRLESLGCRLVLGEFGNFFGKHKKVQLCVLKVKKMNFPAKLSQSLRIRSEFV